MHQGDRSQRKGETTKDKQRHRPTQGEGRDTDEHPERAHELLTNTPPRFNQYSRSADGLKPMRCLTIESTTLYTRHAQYHKLPISVIEFQLQRVTKDIGDKMVTATQSHETLAYSKCGFVGKLVPQVMGRNCKTAITISWSTVTSEFNSFDLPSFTVATYCSQKADTIW